MKHHYTLAFAAFFSLSAPLALAQAKPPLPGMNTAKTQPQPTSKAPAATGKLTPLGDGATVLSSDGKLVWMRCQIGQGYEKGQCTGEPKKMNQRDAENEIKRINLTNGFAGQKDWRLPSIEELQTLVFCEHGTNGRERSVKLAASTNKSLPESCGGESYLRPTIDPVIFPNAATDWVWSSTPDLDRVVNMWAINFASGSLAPVGRVNTQTAARAVRNNK